MSKFDFILLDISSWNQLKQAERNKINRKIASSGMGMIILPNEVGQRAMDINHPSILTYDDGEESNSYYSLSKGWRRLNANDAEIGRYQDYGLGTRIILSKAQTFSYILSNQSNQYHAIWNTILGTAYNQYQTESKLITEKWVWANEKTDITLLSKTPIDRGIMLNDSVQLGAIKDPVISNTYHLTLWPTEGYNTLSFNGEQLSFFAHRPQVYPLVKLNELQTAQEYMPEAAIENTYSIRKVMSPIYGFMTLLIGLGLLWLDERLY